MKMLLLVLTILLVSVISHAGNVSSLSYSGTNVTTAAYVTVVASTPITASHFYICDTSTQILKLAVGTAGNEVDFFTVPINACYLFALNPPLAAGVRLSLKAISASATSGYNTVSFLQ
jgi:hypothetical protein